ncbi:hypothetical protein QJS10_CPB11g00686 [Acorus calamus]|uniref:3'-5' exonuclease domain-containing protein n=1 Tax=Acorus calamus TaxID=4465 RepID=A0AAV9DSL5_ACOCL|nr:hypothetical protein QJS10_CPB11g00686 [Acorus calamus]
MDPKTPETHLVTTIGSAEYALLRRSLRRSSAVGLDAEWKPCRRGAANRSVDGSPSFPTVTLLQIACRLRPAGADADDDRSTDHPVVVFLVDLLSVPLSSVWEMLRDLFVSPDVLKLGFKFKQDLIYLSSTFKSQGCDEGFDKVEPYIDITNIYHCMKSRHGGGKKFSKENKSLATICKEVTGIVLSKELQCSDWSFRPLTKEQLSYASADAYCLLEILTVFQCKVFSKANVTALYSSRGNLGLKEILQESDVHDNVLRMKFYDASEIIKATIFGSHPGNCVDVLAPSQPSYRSTFPLDNCITKIIRKYGGSILLNESDLKPRTSRRKGRKHYVVELKCKEKLIENSSEWQDPPPWHSSFGGDGNPKFLCDVMVEGLAKHLRCVGIDAAIPSLKKPEPRHLIDQADKEKRVLLTRDAKLLKHQYLIRNQVYKVKSLLKNDQLLEVIETFQLKICEDQLMSRCTKCNGRFIQKPLTIEEAIAAAKGFQVIPECLYDRNFEFWQCTDCNQLYWEGTQYQNAVQKFINVCKLN